MVGKLNFCIHISTMKWNLDLSLYKKKIQNQLEM